MANMQKFDVADNVKDESGHAVSPVNEITLLYEMNKEHQRKASIKNKDNIINSDEDESELTEEEKIYKRKSVLSDISVDNISNVNLSVHCNEETVKKEQFLTPTFGSRTFKHHSLTSLSSNNSENTNIPNLLIRNSSNNLSIASTSSSNNNICIGNPLTQSPTMSPALSPTLSTGSRNKKNSNNDSLDSYSSVNSKNAKSVLPGQDISPIPPVQKPVEINQNLNNVSTGITQFKTSNDEALTVESIHNQNSIKTSSDN